MATKSRRKSPSVSETLFLESTRFSFFQAARLLQGIVKKWRKTEAPKNSSLSVGYDASPLEEAVRFTSFSSLKFASSEIQKITCKAENQTNTEAASNQAHMQVCFMGLTGQSSILPVHFTELEINRIRDKDFALKSFYDLFNHRAISFFYRAWEKYQLPFAYERSKIDNPACSDPITTALHSIVGVGGDVMQKQLQLDAEDMLFYAGFFATPNRSASSLGNALTDILNIPVKVNQFKGEWVALLDEDRMQLPVFPLSGKNNCLGVDSVIGNEVFTVEGKFQLEIGPLNRNQFRSLQPNSQGQAALKHFTRLFVGGSFQFELKYILEDDAISHWILAENQYDGPALGVNTWLLGDGMESKSGELAREIIIDVVH